ncbi:hypothetical protein CB1_000353006 [Camelus ferus]|nr:hypothetical protein CB1_000353006 [Camelus ferus]
MCHLLMARFEGARSVLPTGGHRPRGTEVSGPGHTSESAEAADRDRALAAPPGCCWSAGPLMTPSVKVEKILPKMDGTLLKPAVGPACPATVSSSVKPGLNCPSIPKPPLPSPGQVLNGKGLPAPPTLEKKSEDNSNNRKFLNKRLSEREFDPDIHCGVIDLDTKKPCTRSLTCKTRDVVRPLRCQGICCCLPPSLSLLRSLIRPVLCSVSPVSSMQFCTFGSRQIGRGYYVFDSRWNRLRCALNLMVEKHLNAQLWKKIPPVPSTSPVSTRVPHRTNSVPTSQCGVSCVAAATVSPSPVLLASTCISPNSKSVPAHGTTLNAQPAASGALDPETSEVEIQQVFKAQGVFWSQR